MAENEGTEGQDAGDGQDGAGPAQDATQPTKPKDKSAPPWGSDEEFDPDKAWKLIQNLRSEKEQLKPLAEKAKELEDAQKTEQERLTERLSATEKRAVEAELRAARLEVATEKGLPKSSVKFLTGTTEEELAESADELLALLASSSEEDPKPKPDSRPRERLKPGSGDPDVPVEETDLSKLGERMFSR